MLNCGAQFFPYKANMLCRFCRERCWHWCRWWALALLVKLNVSVEFHGGPLVLLVVMGFHVGFECWQWALTLVLIVGNNLSGCGKMSALTVVGIGCISDCKLWTLTSKMGDNLVINGECWFCWWWLMLVLLTAKLMSMIDVDIVGNARHRYCDECLHLCWWQTLMASRHCLWFSL